MSVLALLLDQQNIFLGKHSGMWEETQILSFDDIKENAARHIITKLNTDQ